MTRSVGIGVVGCGGAAVDIVHAIDWLPDVHLAAAYDRIAVLAAELAEPRGAAVATSLEMLLAHPGVDVVYVALPHDQLAPVAARALEAGRHVLVEKPMALDLATIQALEQVAQRRGLCLGVVFEFRASPAVTESRRLIALGAIGDVQLVRVRTVIDKLPDYWRSGPSGRVADGWRSRRQQAGGGVVLMNAIHQLDVVRYVTGLEFVRATSEVASMAEMDVEDIASATLRLSNRGLLNLVATACSPGARADERIEIDGSKGRLDLPDPYAGGPLRVFLREPVAGHDAGRWLDLHLDPLDAHLALLGSFLAAVRGRAPLLASAGDAFAALAAVLAIYAAAEGGRSVEIPETPIPEESIDA